MKQQGSCSSSALRSTKQLMTPACAHKASQQLLSKLTLEDHQKWGTVSVVVQLLSRVQLLTTPWAAASQAPLSSTISWSLLKSMSIASVLLSNHLILCCPLLLLPSTFPASGSFPTSWLFASGGQTLEFPLQHQSFQWIFRTDFL